MFQFQVKVLLRVAGFFLITSSFNFMSYTESANILVYGLIASHSSRISMTPLMEALTEKGHNVTFLSPFGKDPSLPSKIIVYEPTKWKHQFGNWEDQMGFFEIRKRGLIFKWWYDLRHVGIEACKSLHSDPEYLSWVKTSPKFDLIIVEISLNECAYSLVHLWGSKLVIYSTTSVVPWMMDIHGLPDESSSITDTTLRYQSLNGMSFFERALNALTPVLFTLTWQYDYLPKLEEITRKGLQLKDLELPSFWDIGRNASLIMLSTHYSIDHARSLPPNVIEIGGIVSHNKKQNISQEMESFINSGNGGFMFISFGTLAEFTSFDEQVQKEFIAGLSMFPNVRFIWKSSTHISMKLPSNVFVTKWALQQSLLEHPKVKGFVTHGGMGSISESVHSAVPIICIPVHAEQEMNCNAVSRRKAGITLEIVGLKAIHLENSISSLLFESSYNVAMQELSRVFRDRPMSPLETAVWWTEYVLRINFSNDYIVPLSVYQPWWKRRQIDIWMVTALVVMVTVYAMLTLLRLLLKILRMIWNFRSLSKKKTL